MENWLLKKRYISREAIKQDFGFSDIICDILSKKEFNSPQEIYQYLYPSNEQLYNPFLLKGMKEAVDLINDEIEYGNLIYLALDYDVDGIISGAISYLGLKKLGANCKCILPHRVKDGYGINLSMMEEIKAKGGSTVITFDNGIAAFDAIKHGKSLGLNIIVTDHHDVPFKYENDIKIYEHVAADVIINPKQEGCAYPFKGLCGGAIAYKLIEGIGKGKKINNDFFEEIFPLVSLATICDVMELKGENRAFVALGLGKLLNLKNPGLQALFRALSIENQINTYDVGFKVGPCFNSSGRLETAEKSLELLVLKYRVDEAAKNLVELNETRKILTNEGFYKALELIEVEKEGNNKIFVLYLMDTHESVAGIIASRIKERYNKPTIIITKSEDGLKGSARSVEGFNIFEHISKFKSYLKKFGGHPMAAGLSLDERDFKEFKEKLVSSGNNLPLISSKTYRIDSVLSLKEIDISLAKSLEILEPYGKGNEKPIFASKKVVPIRHEILGKNQNVLKIYFKDNTGEKDFICFNNIDKVLDLFKKRVHESENSDIISVAHGDFDILYHISTNFFRGEQRLQLELISIR